MNDSLEYCSPESLPSPTTGLLSPVDSKADMWSLGMILHRLLFFKLPYRYSSDGDVRSGDGGNLAKLEKEVQNYGGYVRAHKLFVLIGELMSQQVQVFTESGNVIRK